MSECQHLLRPLWMVSSPGWLLSSRVGPSSVGELSSGFSQIIKIIITTISFKISVHELWWQLLTVSLGSQQLRWLPGKAEFCNWLENRVWLGLPYFLYCKKSRNQSQNWYWSRNWSRKNSVSVVKLPGPETFQLDLFFIETISLFVSFPHMPASHHFVSEFRCWFRSWKFVLFPIGWVNGTHPQQWTMSRSYYSFPLSCQNPHSAPLQYFPNKDLGVSSITIHPDYRSNDLCNDLVLALYQIQWPDSKEWRCLPLQGVVPTATRGDDFFENFNMGGGWSLSIQNIILQTFVVVSGSRRHP